MGAKQMKKTGTYKTTRVDAFANDKGTGMYDDIAYHLDEAGLYDSVLVPIPETLDPKTAMNRLNTALCRFFIKIPPGTYLMKRTIWWDTEKSIQIVIMPEGVK